MAKSKRSTKKAAAPKKAKWTKLPALPASEIVVGWLNCSTAGQTLPMDMDIRVGFGMCGVFIDGVLVMNPDESTVPVLASRIEAMAAANPDHDWRISRLTPLHGETFQRHGPNEWVCVISNRGFA